MRRKSLYRNQIGVASFVVTLIMTLIISLIVFAFAQVARREQRTALDNQLSTQAYYAAESGINDAKQRITSRLAAGLPVTADNTCDDERNSPADTILGDDANVRYTCLIIDPTPSELGDSVTSKSGSVFRLKSASVFGPSGIRITWNRTQGGAGELSKCPSADGEVFSPAAAWTTCQHGVMRYELVKTDIPGGLNAALLEQNSMTGFALPHSGGGTGAGVDFAATRGNRNLATSCNDSSCSLVITNLSGSEYYLNVKMFYVATSNVTIERVDGAPFVDSQITVDATGKAQDVLRRVKVTLNLMKTSPVEAALTVGTGPCKQQFISQNPDLTYKYADGGCAE